jgi:aryl-alcohol dehydrogenase-like predicted oxidoreductase
MWQVSGAHGYTPSRYEAVAEMSKYVHDGYTTFDLADIYGPAGEQCPLLTVRQLNLFTMTEDYVGSFLKGSLSLTSNAKECQFLTKWVPKPQEITKKIVMGAVDRSLTRMQVDSIDLLQFHW